MNDAPDQGAGSDLDPAAEQERLDDLGQQIERTAERARDDLEPGGPGRTFTDAGVAAQVEEEGDTEHPPDVPPLDDGDDPGTGADAG
jgi:hypothetical protein